MLLLLQVLTRKLPDDESNRSLPAKEQRLHDTCRHTSSSSSSAQQIKSELLVSLLQLQGGNLVSTEDGSAID